MTALLVVKHIKNLDQKVTISKEAAALGGSSMELKEGEVVTVRQLLYGLMILSGNDAAYSLAEVVSNGNVDEFVKMMNDEAKALGCKDTNFVNPNGRLLGRRLRTDRSINLQALRSTRWERPT